jgi:hypothetical protein
MKYLPFEDFEIHTTLTSDEVFYKLRAAVDTQRKWWIFTNKPFWGEVHRHYFRMWRPTWWSRRIIPVVFGRTQPAGTGSCLRIRMRLPWHNLFFLIIWLGLIWCLFFIGVTNLIIQKIQTGIWQIESPWFLLLPIGMFAFVYLLSVGIFKSETNYVKEYLLWLSGASRENITYIDRIFGITETQIIMSLFLVTVVASLGWIVFSLLR